MKLKVGDQVIVTTGKDKGKKSVITRVVPKQEKVVVEGVNLYVRHVRKMAGQAGQKMTLERPLAASKVAILNDKGEADRIGYKFEADGTKVRVFKKTGQVIVIKEAKKDKKGETKTKKAAEIAAKEAQAAEKGVANRPQDEKASKRGLKMPSLPIRRKTPQASTEK